MYNHKSITDSITKNRKTFASRIKKLICTLADQFSLSNCNAFFAQAPQQRACHASDGLACRMYGYARVRMNAAMCLPARPYVF
jgi:hypothetical protein